MQHLPYQVVFCLPFIIKTFVMKKIVLAFLSMFHMLTVNAQSGEKNLQKRQVSGFNGVDVSGGIDLYLSYGTESVAILPTQKYATMLLRKLWVVSCRSVWRGTGPITGTAAK